MEENKIKLLQEKLETLRKEELKIILEGFLKGEYSINKFNYNLKKDKLNIYDEGGENKLEINLNQVYKIEYDTKKVKFYLDNDIIIVLKD